MHYALIVYNYIWIINCESAIMHAWKQSQFLILAKWFDKIIDIMTDNLISYINILVLAVSILLFFNCIHKSDHPLSCLYILSRETALPTD